MEKYTSSQIVRKLVSASTKIEGKYPNACDEILICAEKITNYDNTYMENYDNAISILKDDVLASALNSERDIIKEAQFDWGGAVKGIGKDIGKGIGQMWNKGKEKFREYGYQNITKQMAKEVNDAFDKFRDHLDVNIISKEVDGIVAKYGGKDGKGGITSKIPQSLRVNFDNYLNAIKNIPIELEQANEKAIELMNGFMKKNQDKLTSLATPLTGEAPEETSEIKSEAPAPAPAPAGGSSATPQSAKALLNTVAPNPNTQKHRKTLTNLINKNQTGTVGQLANAINSMSDASFKSFMNSEIPDSLQEILTNPALVNQPLKSVLTAAQKIELVRISRTLEDKGFIKQASAILDTLSKGLK